MNVTNPTGNIDLNDLDVSVDDQLNTTTTTTTTTTTITNNNNNNNNSNSNSSSSSSSSNSSSSSSICFTSQCLFNPNATPCFFDFGWSRPQWLILVYS